MGVEKDSLNLYFELDSINPYQGVEEILPEAEIEKKSKIMMLYADNQLIDKEVIRDSTVQKILASILTKDSRIHLGDFWVPQEKQKIVIVSHELFECKRAIRESKFKRCIPDFY